MKDDFTSSTIKSLNEESRERGKVALVLGGGGARGYAHLGVAQVLEEEGLEPDLVVGTSMGAIIGAAVANGANLDGMIKVLNRLDVNKILKISREGRRELEKAIGKSLVREIGVRKRRKDSSSSTPVKLARLFTFFKLMTKNSNIEDLPLKYAAVATELEEGREVVIKQGKVFRATAASAAIPGFIPPVRMNNQALIDGGIVDPLPILPALEMGAGAVLAVDVGRSLEGKGDHSPLSLLYRSDQIRRLELTRTKNSIAYNQLGDRLTILDLPVDDLNWLDFNGVEAGASIGRTITRENLFRVKEIFDSCRE